MREGSSGRARQTSDSKVTLRFMLTRSEMCSCHRRLQARGWRNWVYVAVGIVFAVLGVVDSAAWLIIFGVVYALLYAAGIWLIAPRMIWRRTPQIRAEQAVTVSDAGILMTWTNASTRADWSFWRKVRRIGDAYVLQGRPRGLCVIPRRAFESPVDERRFAELVASTSTPRH